MRCTKPAAAEEDEEWEQLDDDAHGSAVKPTDAEQERQTFETNTAEDVIAVDHSNEPALLETFGAFQTKLTVMADAASRLISAQQHMATETESSVDTPADADPVLAAGAVAAAKEQCRTIVLETQELIKKLTKPEIRREPNSPQLTH